MLYPVLLIVYYAALALMVAFHPPMRFDWLVVIMLLAAPFYPFVRRYGR